jgi:hypothetical protein
VYFNGLLWHSDTAKAAEYQAATPLVKSYIRKCAEIRTITAVPFVRALHSWITKVSGEGYDLCSP